MSDTKYPLPNGNYGFCARLADKVITYLQQQDPRGSYDKTHQSATVRTAQKGTNIYVYRKELFGKRRIVEIHTGPAAHSSHNGAAYVRSLDEQRLSERTLEQLLIEMGNTQKR